MLSIDRFPGEDNDDDNGLGESDEDSGDLGLVLAADGWTRGKKQRRARRRGCNLADVLMLRLNDEWRRRTGAGVLHLLMCEMALVLVWLAPPRRGSEIANAALLTELDFILAAIGVVAVTAAACSYGSSPWS